MLDKAKLKAKQAEFSSLSLEILEFEKHIEGQYITRSIEGRADIITNETIELLKVIKNNHQFSNLSLQLYGLYLKIGFVRNFKDYEMVKLFLMQNYLTFLMWNLILCQRFTTTRLMFGFIT